MKHIEEIVEYIVDGDDLQYFDNHGSIVRCRDCRLWDALMRSCRFSIEEVRDNDYCSRGFRKEDE